MTEGLNNNNSKKCVCSIGGLMKSFWDHMHIGVWVGEGLPISLPQAPASEHPVARTS